MSARRVSLRREEYRDSGTLMRLTRALEARPGVLRAAAVMATPRNLEMLFQLGFAEPAALEGAQSKDLAVLVVAETELAAEEALAAVDALLRPAQSASGSAAVERPRRLESALEVDPEASLAVISVPGPFAAREARRALERGLHVFLFSNGVSVEQERALKELARERGLVVMGPDCGTALLDGVPLGFANRVPRGGVGIVGASGTGVQELCSLLAERGAGVSHAFGTGGRDLSPAVGGLSALFALQRLGEDASTELVVLVSKPPAPEVAERVLDAARATGKRVIACFLGVEDGERDGVQVRGTLEGAALAACEALGLPSEPRDLEVPHPVAAPESRLVGLYTGGSLAFEALVLLRRAGLEVSSNLHLAGVRAPGAGGHTVLDLGEDEYTRGRPHPMIDPGVRVLLLEELAADESVGIVLLDCVLGTAAHEDPAGALAPSLRRLHEAARARGRELVVLASVTGTEADAQVRSRQVAALREAGAIVVDSNAAAVRAAVRALGPQGDAA